MQFKTEAQLMGIQSSKGEFDGRAFDSTTFHLAVDIGEKSTGETMGTVTRPFKKGTSAEITAWKPHKANWPAAGVPVICTFTTTAGADNSSKLTLIDIRPKA